MENLYKEILNYEPFCESEVKDRECMLEALRLGKDLLSRYMLMHFTASAFVVNPSRTKMLVVYHNIMMDLFIQVGTQMVRVIYLVLQLEKLWKKLM